MCNNYSMTSSSWYPLQSGSTYNFVMDTPASSSREMRNRAEKMRRDKLNSFIGELATLVPMVARSAKRMDKTSILRLTATHLRIYQTLLNGKNSQTEDDFPKVDQFVLEQLVFEQLSGFLLILTNTGKIVFVSHTVENLLGHLQTDLMGQSIYNITYTDDHDRMRLHIGSEDLICTEWRKYFNARLKRAGPRSETPVYEMVTFMGMQRTARNAESRNGSNSKDVVSSSGSSNNVLIFFVKLSRPEAVVDRLIEATKDEYVTRHLVDGRITTADQRISYVAGYMTEEVSGISAFKFMHRDDVRWVMIALRQMYDRGESRGSSCYRLLSRTGQFIYLKTYGFLEINNSGTVESFVCINALVSEEEGQRLIREMKERYSALIKAENPLAITSCGEADTTVQSVEDPQELELAIAHLVTNLPLSPDSESRSTPSPQSAFENQDCPNTEERHTCSPNLPHPIRIKTVSKRPPSTDLGMNLYKRRKSAADHLHSPPYQRPILEEIAHKKNNTYQQDQFLRHKV
ncbi:aryl hydrocarbon receptor nuclear translocator-like protein 1 isoform X1 [Photinus pyralis]|uniref:aryl hydrocarbon receptor nuclear translocator-like protein 1 isoform X1 n=1 Tax=Photinus pyralis TaxID=7054 RepID=UPI00126742D1|nr:aryl hydrocarbon receptor nuclear translocator-like protein 1 isoform X1 [Photinus pyralis]